MIFLDTETTGLDPYWNQICQLSYIITDDNMNITAAKNFFLDVDVDIELGALRTHGLSKDKLKKLSKGIKFVDIAEEVYNDFKNQYVVCHNVDFDTSFLEKEINETSRKFDIENTFCTMEYYTDILQIRNYYGYKWPKLEEVIAYLDLNIDVLYSEAKKVFSDSEKYHDSRFDVYLTYKIYMDDIKRVEDLYKEKMKELEVLDPTFDFI